jgi:hypothetical protein
MTFRRVAPQIFENTDGYTVQVGSRTTVEYLEGVHKVIVEIECSSGSTCVYANRITRLTNGRPISISEGDTRQIIERVFAALRFDGSSVEIFDH